MISHLKKLLYNISFGVFFFKFSNMHGEYIHGIKIEGWTQQFVSRQNMMSLGQADRDSVANLEKDGPLHKFGKLVESNKVFRS